jgi:hypothetical protein
MVIPEQAQRKPATDRKRVLGDQVTAIESLNQASRMPNKNFRLDGNLFLAKTG